jgi:integrase
MTASVYKICDCRDPVKCRHPWWFSFKRRGARRIRKSLDVVLERHVEGKGEAIAEAQRLRIGMVDDTLPARTRQLLGLPPSATPILATLTVGQLLDGYADRHLARTATADRSAYQIGAVKRTVIARPDGTGLPLSDWLATDVTVDALERLREARSIRDVHAHAKGRNRVGGLVAANRDLRVLRAAFNWAIRKKLVRESPFRIGTESSMRLSRELSRSRRLQGDEGDRLLNECGSRLRAIVEAALETGCRKGELLNLRWSQVQLGPRPELWLPADKTKTGKARRVPLSTRLQAVLAMRRHDPAGDPLPATAFVFGNAIGQRVGAIKTAWRLACERAKITDLHFHDLRREAGSRWAEAGVPLVTIQKWLGHANISQTSTYLATTMAGEHEQMRKFEERMGRLTRVDTGGATPPQTWTQATIAEAAEPSKTPVSH